MLSSENPEKVWLGFESGLREDKYVSLPGTSAQKPNGALLSTTVVVGKDVSALGTYELWHAANVACRKCGLPQMWLAANL